MCIPAAPPPHSPAAYSRPEARTRTHALGHTHQETPARNADAPVPRTGTTNWHHHITPSATGCARDRADRNLIPWKPSRATATRRTSHRGSNYEMAGLHWHRGGRGRAPHHRDRPHAPP